MFDLLGRARLLACIVALAGVAAANATTPAAAPALLPPTKFVGGSEPERESIRNTVRRWGERLEKRDLDGMVALYEADAVIFSSGRPAVVGRDAIRKLLARLVDAPPRAHMNHLEEVVIEGPRAFATLLSASRARLPDGTVRESTSRTLVTFRRGGDNVWRFSRDADMPTPDANVLLAQLPAAPAAPGFAGQTAAGQSAAAKPSPEALPPRGVARDLAVLRRIHDDWIATYTAGSVDALAKFYVDDTVLMPDGRPTYRGWSQIRAFFAPGFERFNYAASADLQTLESSGDLATAKGVVTVTLTPKAPASGEPVTRALRYLIVFKRLQDDDWRIWLDMDNRVP
jgi:uncharacterized protein (TIGR02246 family)